MNTGIPILLAALFMSQPAAANAVYHGFSIDDHLLTAGQKDRLGAIFPSIVDQIAIVESVQLPSDVLSFFKKTHIIADPALEGNPGYFTVHAGEGLVSIKTILFPANRPILLHELLHAYHYKILTVGNRDILESYRKAKSAGVYPKESQSANFLTNAREYFAVASTIYLFGEIQQAPFDCEVLSKSDPDYLAFLAKIFGRHACKSR
jgi:hypothetical protein